MKQYALDLDDFGHDSPTCTLDVGGLRAYIIVNADQRAAAIEEMVQKYRADLEAYFLPYEEANYDHSEEDEL